jgi:hypothetical protein
MRPLRSHTPDFALTAAGTLAAGYLRLVWATSRFDVEPKTLFHDAGPDFPLILAMWHGQHLMMPFLMRPGDRAKVLISRHRDGEINAVAAEKLGVGTIRGSGDHKGRFWKKGGVSAMMEMIETLKGGTHVALTADVPKVGRRCGLGIVMLAKLSGRPIYPVAMATNRRWEAPSWDRMAVNLPFSKGALVGQAPIRVPRDADDAAMEAARQAVEASLDAVTARAYAIAEGRATDLAEVGRLVDAKAGRIAPRAALPAPEQVP